MHTKRILSVITASTVLFGSLSSCSLLNYVETSNVASALTRYLTTVHGNDFNGSAELVTDEEDAFLVNEMNDTEAELIAAILAASEFDLGDIEIDGDSATAEVTLTLPDIESIADEGYSYDEFLEAIGDLDDTTDETLDFELVKADDAWLIEADSTEEYFNLLMDLIADLKFTSLTEENALDLVETFIGLMSEGNLSEAGNMITPNGNAFASYIATASVIPEMSGLLTSYCGRLTYTSEVTEVADEYIIVTVSGTAPDLQAVINAVIDNEEVMVPIYADYIEAAANGVEFNYFSIAGSLLDAVGAELDTAQTGPVEFTFKVTENEDGELRLEITSGPEIDVDMDALMSRTDYIVPAIAQLLSEGRITLDQVLELQQMYGV